MVFVSLVFASKRAMIATWFGLRTVAYPVLDTSSKSEQKPQPGHTSPQVGKYAPRASGDGPAVASRFTLITGRSPRERGWTHGDCHGTARE
jgi:hypothetical protein